MKTINRYNVVVLGRTGVGKSTLVNYLYGKNEMETGVGESVTKAGFHPRDTEIEGFPVRIFDSWGLEPGKSEDWLQYLHDELSKHSTAYSIEEWFHSIFFCIDASSHRIQPMEVEIIKKFVDEKYSLTIILTKADADQQEQIKDFSKKIQQEIGHKVPIIPASCCEPKVLISGRKIEPFGKEQIKRQVYANFWDSLSKRLPERCKIIMCDKIDNWKQIQKTFINENVGVWNKIEMEQEMQKRTEILVEEINKREVIFDEISKAANMYKNFIDLIKIPPVSKNAPKDEFIATFPESKIGEFSGWDYLLLPLMPILMPIFIFTARADNKKDILDGLNQTVLSMKKYIKETTPKIEEAINSIKINHVK
ncbi:MAG: GTPase domain-containing protein [Chitinophagales bacterium]